MCVLSNLPRNRAVLVLQIISIMISKFRYSENDQRSKKIICDCAMSLNDDREKHSHKGKRKSLRGKSDQSIVPTEISTGVLDSRYWAKILYTQSLQVLPLGILQRVDSQITADYHMIQNRPERINLYHESCVMIKQNTTCRGLTVGTTRQRTTDSFLIHVTPLFVFFRIQNNCQKISAQQIQLVSGVSTNGDKSPNVS